MHSFTRRTLTALVFMMLPATGYGDDLLFVYQQALLEDPQLQAAAAAHQAALEIAPQSLAALLPDIRLNGDISRNRFEERRTPPPGEEKVTHYTNKSYGATLQQTLYRRDRFIQLAQADTRVAQADAEYAAAQQDLILRVATRYFLVLGAIDNLNFVKADKAAIGRTLEQAKQRFDVGLTAITDVLEAQARYDLVISEEINAEKLLDDAREGLRELTGELYEDLAVLKQEIPLFPPEPQDPKQWVATGVEQNPQLLAAIAATEAARQEIQVQRSGHYPSVDIVAEYSRRDNNFGGLVPIKRNDSAIGLEATLPLYQGGAVSSRTRQARDEFTQAQELQEQQRREIERLARNNYRGVITGISKVNALRQAVVSNETALEAAEAGFEVGTRTIVDVLDFQRELLRAKRDWARSRYDYLLDTLRLKQAAGIVDESDIAQINAMLQ